MLPAEGYQMHQKVDADGLDDNHEYVVFACVRFDQLQREMPALSVANIVDKVCTDEGTWNAVSRAISQIMPGEMIID